MNQNLGKESVPRAAGLPNMKSVNADARNRIMAKVSRKTSKRKKKNNKSLLFLLMIVNCKRVKFWLKKQCRYALVTVRFVMQKLNRSFQQRFLLKSHLNMTRSIILMPTSYWFARKLSVRIANKP